MIKDIWKAQGFDIRIYESLIQSCVNLMQRLAEKDYFPHLTYVEPLTNGY